MKYKKLKFEEVDSNKLWVEKPQPCYFCYDLRDMRTMAYGCSDFLYKKFNENGLIPWAVVEEFCDEACMNLFILSRIEE